MPRRRKSEVGAAEKIALVVMAPRLGVSQICRLMGFSRDTYYRLAKMYRDHGLNGLLDTNAGDGCAPRVSSDVESAILTIAAREPRLGKVKVAARVKAVGLAVSPSGVACVWKRHQLALTEQRVERAAGASSSEAERATWDAILAEQRHLTAEVARLSSLLEREQRKAPSRSRVTSPSIDPSPRSDAPRRVTDMLRDLFGFVAPPVAEPPVAEQLVAVQSGTSTPTGQVSSVLAELFGSPVSPGPASGGKAA